jgi:hypothetical protein
MKTPGFFLLVVAAGNGGMFPPTQWVSPATAKNGISVGSEPEHGRITLKTINKDYLY